MVRSNGRQPNSRPDIWGAPARAGHPWRRCWPRRVLCRSAGISRESTVDLQTQATTRDDLLNDAFVAVFDRLLSSGMADTVRVVAPSEAATREILAEHLKAMYAGTGSRKSVGHPTVRANFPDQHFDGQH